MIHARPPGHLWTVDYEQHFDGVDVYKHSKDSYLRVEGRWDKISVSYKSCRQERRKAPTNQV